MGTRAHRNRTVPWLLLSLLCAACDSHDAGPASPPTPRSVESPARPKRSEPARPAAQQGRPNVLLISIDTLRSDHLGAYGYHRQTSPVIDRLASEGALFEQHISSTSWTLPAHAALFTSLPDSVHGCTDTDKPLSNDRVTLAERFLQAGYATAGFFAGPYLHPAFGLGQGFELYEDCTSYAEQLDSVPSERWAMDMGVMKASHRDVTNPRVLRAFRRWFEARGERPFFAFVHLWDVHFDFIPPPPYDTKFDPDYQGDMTGENFFFNPRVHAGMPKRDLEHLIALYDGEIAWTDHHVGLLLGLLTRAGILDHTVIAVTSDHGTEFFEHGHKGHRITLYDEVIRVPLVLRYPAAVPRGVRVRRQTRSIDMGPSLLQLAGLAPPDGVMGRSLQPLLRPGPADRQATPPALSELFSIGRKLRTVRTADGKLLHDLAHDKQRYFALKNDPGEQRPLDDFDTPLGRDLRAAYATSIAALELHAKQPATDGKAQIPGKVVERLKALGYVK